MTTLRLDDIRRHVVASQGYATRYRRATDDEVVQCVRRLSCVQLDSIATVERSHLLVLGSRIGAVDGQAVSRLLASGQLFEYWGHEACLMAVEDWPLLGFRMRERETTHQWWGPLIETEAELAAHILSEIRERGPLASRHFEGQGGGGMWRLKPAKKMLDCLWTAGKLVICGRQGFQRVYDLPERVLDPKVLSAPVMCDDETLRALIVRAVRARGALTASGIREHYRLRGRVDKLTPHLVDLCRSGELREYAIEDGGPPVYVPADSDPRKTPPPSGATLLSPFENLLWDRPFARRVFKFDHLIEVYKREHERAYGYYVLPLLVGDRFVGRADLKARRDAGRLELKSFHFEPGVRQTAALSSHLDRALARLAKTLGLDPP